MKAKKCKECGKIFIPRCGTQVYCDGPHTSICVICGKEFSYTVRPTEKPHTCSKECQENLRSKTAMDKYGVKNVSELDFVRRKISEKLSSDEVDAKRRKHNIAKWGVDNPSKNPEIRKKLSAVMKTDRYLSGREQTCIEKYGYSSPMRSQEVKDRQKQTNLEKYGMLGHPHSIENFSKMMIDGSKVENYLEFKQDPGKYIDSHYLTLPSIYQLEKDLGVTNTPIYNILIENNCRDKLLTTYSYMENEVIDFLLSVDPNLNIIQNDRVVIKPKEIDIYLPDYKFGIECNPTATHNSSFSDPWGAEPKYYKYHLEKSTRAQEVGIFLFHLFGYEWVNKKEIMKSMICNLLHKNSIIYNGRDTYVCELSYNDCEEFLNSNHRQGSTISKVRLGLKLKSTDELVSVMTFGHMRTTMGKVDTSTENTWELSRFCNKINTTVRGSASKLFKYFINNYQYDKIVSFSDIAHTKGDLYNILGFKHISVSSPSYVWCDGWDNIYYNRVSCQKHNLKNLFPDEDIDIENQSEAQIMEAHKFARVYDCGVIRWEY